MGLLLLHRHCTGNRMDFLEIFVIKPWLLGTNVYQLFSFDHPVDMRIFITESGIWSLVLDQKKSPDFITRLTV